MVSSNIQRFEIWLVNLNSSKGREIKKTRPCVVISPNELSALATVLVAPMTTKGFEYPCRVECEFIGKKDLILLDQIRAVDKMRLAKKLGILDNKTQVKLCDSLHELFVF
ncbi:transcriptional modulator of MazE/toxin, MazF [methanotrophic bacterial endosymbiont of Bathymodiolus sp.]|jgi:mRNA interferase MazF|nr:transcriptional modulator of MazE/toxin, MazF [methanotrophic bacterial endosymbiont of Bathymodiolus sp.]